MFTPCCIKKSITRDINVPERIHEYPSCSFSFISCKAAYSAIDIYRKELPETYISHPMPTHVQSGVIRLCDNKKSALKGCPSQSMKKLPLSEQCFFSFSN